VTPENPAGHPCRRPTHREVPKWQKHEAGTRKLVGGRVSGGIPNQVSSVRRIAQVPHEGAPVVDGAPAEVAKGLRMGGRNDHATSLGQGHDADEAGKPGHWRHVNWPTERLQTAIPPLQQVRLAGAGRATLSWRHISSASMTAELV
jgi:hypothetical protein